VSSPVIECLNVARAYPGGIQALRGVSLTVQHGDFLAIVGPSGSGKSTLLNLMGTLDRPDEGTVRIGGTDIASMPDRRLSRIRAERIGFVFQQFHLSALMDVRDNVAEGLLYAGVPHAERRRRATDILGSLGLGDRLNHRSHMLSGGERQRVAIARALMGDPDVILADEPTGNLDTVNGHAIIATLRDLATDGTAVVVITHDLELASVMDRRVELRDGRIVRTPDNRGEEQLSP
jgi:putative ABC transport system ATP-binding protein